jgi:hypothetical protein
VQVSSCHPGGERPAGRWTTCHDGPRPPGPWAPLPNCTIIIIIIIITTTTIIIWTPPRIQPPDQRDCRERPTRWIPLGAGPQLPGPCADQPGAARKGSRITIIIPIVIVISFISSSSNITIITIIIIIITVHGHIIPRTSEATTRWRQPLGR